MKILVPETEWYLQGFKCEVAHVQSLCSFGEISEKSKMAEVKSS